MEQLNVVLEDDHLVSSPQYRKKKWYELPSDKPILEEKPWKCCPSAQVDNADIHFLFYPNIQIYKITFQLRTLQIEKRGKEKQKCLCMFYGKK